MIRTGIVRRIDHLGRVVLPREMRKTMRINEGDPLEISLSEGGILLKKYSPIQSFSFISKFVAKSLYESLEKSVVITDTDKILCAFTLKQKDLVDKQISSSLTQVIKDKKSVALSKQDGSKTLPLLDNEDLSADSQIIVPIVKNGDCFGLVVVFGQSDGIETSSEQIKLVRLCANILAENCD